MAEGRGLRVLRVLYRVAKVSTALFLGIEVTLFAASIATMGVHSGGYVGTNLSSDAMFFGAVSSPLLVLSALALFTTACLGRWRDAPEARTSYRGGLILAGIALSLAAIGLVIGFGFMGGGIIPH